MLNFKQVSCTELSIRFISLTLKSRRQYRETKRKLITCFQGLLLILTLLQQILCNVLSLSVLKTQTTQI